MKFIQFFKNWTLPIGMTIGVAMYFVYDSFNLSVETQNNVTHAISIIQPTLIFFMLFLSFCKVSPRDLKPQRWHLWLALIQGLSFVVLSLIIIIFPETNTRVLIEGAMLCMICPTATAAAVITGKLGGNTAHLITYTIIINLVTAVLTPLFLPLVEPMGYSTGTSFLMILYKVFPLLICPLLLAWFIEYVFPKVHQWILRSKDLAFYIWSVSLALALSVTTKAIVHSHYGLALEIGIAAVSLFCCFIQFYIGRKIGSHYNDTISAGQAMGQKNTVFAIWMAYTFMSPITSIAGGFYCIWHNAFNSYQLYKQRKDLEKQKNADTK